MSDESNPSASPSVSPTVSRDMFRQVVRQRQDLKRELKQLKEATADLPPDWADRLPAWLDLEQRAEALTGGELIDKADLESATETWRDRERDYQARIGRLTLAERIRAAANRLAAYDPEDVVALTSDLFQVRFEGGRPLIGPGDRLDRAGLHRPGEDETELSVDDVVARFLEQKPHLVRPQGAVGSGSRPRLTKPTTSDRPDPAAQARRLLADRRRLQGRPNTDKE